MLILLTPEYSGPIVCINPIVDDDQYNANIHNTYREMFLHFIPLFNSFASLYILKVDWISEVRKFAVRFWETPVLWKVLNDVWDTHW